MQLAFSFIIRTFVFLPLFLSVTPDEIDKSCTPFNCGNFINVTYPFWNFNTQPSYCGHPGFKLYCQNGHLTIEIKSQEFRILHLNQTSQLLRISREDFYDLDANHKRYCPKDYINVDVDSHFFNYTANNENYTALYDCGPFPSYLIPEISDVFLCLKEDITQEVYVVRNSKLADFVTMKCKNSITIPGIKYKDSNSTDAVMSFLDKGFEVKWGGVGEDKCHACISSGGICGFKNSKNTCLLHRSLSSKAAAGTWNLKKRLLVGVISMTLATLVIAIIYIYRRRHSNRDVESDAQSVILTSHPSRLESQRFARNKYFGVQYFTSDDLKQATNDFSKQIGDGAGGTVFYGELPDGRRIAVKEIHNNLGDDQFNNELDTLSYLAHPNLVSLYGCTTSQLQEPMIVYEYVSNGTVNEHLQGQRETHGNLPWSIRMNIAVETASALKYLHASNIIHRDIKTSNILLDDDLHVKLADFGISRIFPSDQSHALTEPRGTVGYVAPECVAHEDQKHCELTYKSDVFNFGVVLVELITSLPAYYDFRPVKNLHEMAITRIQNGTMHELVDSTLGYGSDPNVEKMINLVIKLAGECLHESRQARPTMNKVWLTLQEIQRVGKNEMQHDDMNLEGTNDEIQLLNQFMTT
ncbi:LEAF RUST 10 DISEASE-RESISTANCE LOCUS RECEPTOR-LIKE PROTEIN KINASE-like 1.2 isoform X2 [Vicia villosa]|uniref:LEAF RUST 10 DISEASE-RESISTANCE LOCUS RECEPTOR-LIKE PROTEIN KINASE-like 1.2 isoform X2 n=1 Tax=Vicia villosa TaxID=3911 RepID=UPI00273CC641|nr:LEAF RUST 10 DISEASE-RESISTANCE LOCUS RECEPTOR-LIKE PROTEIN KINASE-like 1.2 isoform X2 [Vicia villosa]